MRLWPGCVARAATQDIGAEKAKADFLVARRRDPTSPSLPTIKRLFTLSSNRCAFSRCPATIIDGSTVVGKVCHIKGAKPGSARHDAQQSAAKRHGFDNLILMCGRHHDVIDDKENEEAYPVERLLKMKADHESRAASIDDDFAGRAAHLLINQSVTSANQWGGITAHTVRADTINLYASPAPHTSQPSSPAETSASPLEAPLANAFADRAAHRMEILGELLQHLCDARDWFQAAVRRGRTDSDPPMEECARRCRKAAALAQRMTLGTGKLLIPPELVKDCNLFFSVLDRGLAAFALALDPRTPSGPQMIQCLDAAGEIGYKELPPIMQHIEETAYTLHRMRGDFP
jgi:hypothetical protein